MSKYAIRSSFETVQRIDDGKFAVCAETLWSDGTKSEIFSTQGFDSESDAWEYAKMSAEAIKQRLGGDLVCTDESTPTIH